MTARTLNIGLIGSGFMGQAHADAFRRAAMLYRDLPAVPRLAVLADATPELAASAARRFGFERSTGDWRALVEDPEIDVVDITSPNALHHEMALAAIAAGKHVYCEKPLAVTLAEAEEMAAAAKARGVKTMVAFNNVKTPAAMLARQIIDRGEIGTPMRFRGWFDQGFFNDPELPFRGRCTRRLAGSGALGDLGSHVISVAQYLMGDIDRTIPGADLLSTRPLPQGGSGYRATAGADAPRAPVENENQIQALVRFRSGGPARSRRRASPPARCSASTGVSGTRARSSWTASFNELKISRFNDPSPTAASRPSMPAPGSQFSAFFGFDFAGGGLGYFDVKVIEVRDLIEGIVNDADCFPNFAFGLANERVIDAMERSLASGRWEKAG